MFEINFPDRSTPFSTSYQCYPLSFYPGKVREEIENGGNIFLPPSALEHLSRLNVQYPMLFKLTNNKGNRTTHCGVLEFVADEGRMYVPYWMLSNLLLEEGDTVQVKSMALNKAEFAKFQPQDVSFLDISNPKAVLEKALRGFACLTVDDMIAIKYNDRTYELKVLETKPSKAVSIIECDMRVDFAPPVGYVENSYKIKNSIEKNKDENESLIPTQVPSLQVFGGKGVRLDGRVHDSAVSAMDSSSPSKPIRERGLPKFDYQPGSLRFLRVNNKGLNEGIDAFKAFEGQGVKLKPSTKMSSKT